MSGEEGDSEGTGTDVEGEDPQGEDLEGEDLHGERGDHEGELEDPEVEDLEVRGEREDDLWWEDLGDVHLLEAEAEVPCADSETEEPRLAEAALDSDGNQQDLSLSFALPEDWDDHWNEWEEQVISEVRHSCQPSKNKIWIKMCAACTNNPFTELLCLFFILKPVDSIKLQGQ